MGRIEPECIARATHNGTKKAIILLSKKTFPQSKTSLFRQQKKELILIAQPLKLVVFT